MILQESIENYEHGTANKNIHAYELRLLNRHKFLEEFLDDEAALQAFSVVSTACKKVSLPRAGIIFPMAIEDCSLPVFIIFFLSV